MSGELMAIEARAGLAAVTRAPLQNGHAQRGAVYAVLWLLRATYIVP